MNPALIILLVCLGLGDGTRADGLFGHVQADTVALTPNLAQTLSGGISALAQNTNATWVWSSWNFGTNSALWTWPVNLACAGQMKTLYYAATLVTPNEAVYAGHVVGYSLTELVGTAMDFIDTNGVPWQGWVSNCVNVSGDFCVAIFSNRAPATIPLPGILPPNFTNFLAAHSLQGIPSIWPHPNEGWMQLMVVSSDIPGVEAGTEPGKEWFPTTFFPASDIASPWAQGTLPWPGDSSSPQFLVYGEQPVFLFATHTASSSGPFISDPAVWTNLCADGLTNGLNMINVSGFRQFP
jgi:hypothetical protein